MTDVAVAPPSELACAVEQAWARWLEETSRRDPPPPRDYVYASAWRPCERRMVYELVAPHQQTPFPTDVLARFRRGSDRERDLLTDLRLIGRATTPHFEIEGQQQGFPVHGRDGSKVISGKIDGKLRFEHQRVGAPLEVKAWASTTVERIETFDDVFENPWTRSGGYQLLSYLYGNNIEYGFLLLDRSGIPRLLLVELNDRNLERMEAFLARAERVVAHAKAGTLPDFIDDPAECKRCGFYGTVCQPPLSAQPIDVITDPEVEARLEEWWALRDAGKRWRDLDEQVKKQLRGVTGAVAGHFSISGRWGSYARLELPPAIRKQFTVADPKGRFALEIERL